MKYLALIGANLRRKPTRTILTIGSFAVALSLFGLLAAIRAGFSGGIDLAGVDRLVVLNKIGLIGVLPLPYKERMLRIPGVRDVTFAMWFGGVYKDEQNFFPQFAIDSATYRTVFPEIVVPEEQWRDFLQDRTGCIAGESLARRFGWKVGDRIPMRGTIFAGSWEFNLRGIYTGKRPQDDTSQFFLQYDYLQERGPQYFRGLVGWYTVRIANPDDAAPISKAIDAEFSNSTAETRTSTEKAFAASFVNQMGNIEALVMSIGSVVFFTLLLVTGNTMASAVRERTSETAVLKAIGYSDAFLLTLILVESEVIAVAGGLLGLGFSKLITLGGIPTGGMLPPFMMPGNAILAGLAAALIVGALAGAIPAVSAMRLRVVDALRRI
jgi:putative ABC transport system permease protein